MRNKLIDQRDRVRWPACVAACYVLLIASPVRAQTNSSSSKVRFVYTNTEHSHGSLKAFYRGKRVLDLDLYSDLPCSPVFDDTSREIIVGRDNRVEAYSLGEVVIWRKDVEYGYDPHRLLAISGVVIYDDGPNSVPPPQNQQQLRSAIEDSYSVQFVIARNIRSGNEAWSLPWLTIGTPCVTLQRHNFLTVRTPIPTKISNYGSFKNTSIDSRSAKTGKLICRWRLPDWTVGTSDRSKVLLGEFLSYGNWTTVPRSNNSSFVVTAKRRTMEFDKKETSSNKCFIKVVGSSLRLRYQSKSASMTTTLRPVTGRRK